MLLLQALLDVTLPVVLVAGVGVLLARRFRIDRDTVTKISLNGLTPALALQTILNTQVSGRVGLLLVLGFVAVSGLGLGLGWLVTPGGSSRTRRSAAVAVSIGNNGNMGLPIALFALGQPGLDQAVLVFLASIVLIFVVAPLVYGAHQGPQTALLAVLRMPVTWAMAGGALVRWSGLVLPVGVLRGVDLLAAATLPMVLLALGIQLGHTGRVRLTRPVLAASVCRVGAMPLLGLAVGYGLGLRGLPLQTLVLANAMPTAVNAYLLATEYDGDVELVAHTVTVTTVLSFLSAAVVTALLPQIGAL